MNAKWYVAVFLPLLLLNICVAAALFASSRYMT
jgi:hypothetical protein